MTSEQTHQLVDALITLLTAAGWYFSHRNRKAAADSASLAAQHAVNAGVSAQVAAESVAPPPLPKAAS